MNAFSAIPESDLAPEPRFYIEPKDKNTASEKQRVVQFRNELRLKLPSARWLAVPNAGKRGQMALNQARSEGASWGAPDGVLLWNGESVYLEWKAGNTNLSDHQVDWLNWLHDNGYPCAVVRTAEGAFAFLRKLGWPV